MENTILLKKSVVTCFFLRMMKTTAKSFLFVKKRNVLLAFFIAISFFTNVFAQAPCPNPEGSPDFDIVNPTHADDCTILTGDCTSKDLYVLDAFLVAENECNSCDGNESITAQLWLTLVNDTGSTRTSFAIFGTLNTYDDQGSLTGSCSISRCIETIEKNSSTPRYYGDIEYTCGDNLKLVDIIQSWTDAGKPSTCPNHDCKEISPKCGFSSEIEIKPPLQASATAECKSASTIDIDLTVKGGSGSYSYDWTKEGGGFSSNVEDPAGVSPGKYYVTVTDNEIVDGNGASCTVMTDVTLAICCEDAVADDPSDETKCDEYILPALTNGAYFTGTGGAGNSLSAGDKITSTQTIYVYAAGVAPCQNAENSFLVTINDTPLADDPSDETKCDEYILPALTNGAYFTGTGGTGNSLGAGDKITSTQTIYVYTAGVSPCPDIENSFLVTINDTPLADDPSDETKCDEYILPALTNGAYFTGTGGTGNSLSAGDKITSTQTIYVYTAGVSPCPDTENSFLVTINDTPLADDPSDETKCDEYILPALTNGAYFTGTGGTGNSLSAGDKITSTQTIYVYTAGVSPCPDTENSFLVTINLQPDAGDDGDTKVCDSSTDPINLFDLIKDEDSGGVWSRTGGTGGTFDNGAGKFTPAPGATTSTFKYALTGTAPCVNVSSVATVNIERAKDPGLDCNLIICFEGVVTADELFNSLNGTPEPGGIWSPLPLGGAGTYTYTFAATNTCPEVSAEVAVTEQSEITSSTERFHVSCHNGANGKIILNVLGGTPPYTYLWSNGKKTKDISDLSAGLYSVKITDARLCMAENSARINQPDKLRAEIICGHLTCNSDSNGALYLDVTGGTPPYTYLWSNGETVEDPVGLPGGIYSVVVTDANGCTVEQSTAISQPDLLICNIVQDSPCSSNGGSDGVATVVAEGGKVPYTYLWDNGETNATATNLTAGVHSVTVTDDLNCQTTCEITITEPNELICSVELNNHVLCKGDSSGSATVTASYGATPYTYLWDNGENTQTATNLNAGLHSVTVTDAYQAVTSCTIMITEPDVLEASAIGGAVISCSCYGGSDGSIDLTVTGGTPDYTYLWNNGAITEDLSDLVAGTYSVTITDAKGCTTTEEVAIGEPGMLSCEITQDSPSSAHDANDGVATVTPSGGTSPYTYLWDNDETTAQAISLNVGVHSVTVTDDLGCYTTCEIIIECLPNALRCTVAKNSDVTCYDGEDGSAKVTAEGGVPPYKFSWSNGENTQTATSLSEGLHTVTVTDDSLAETTCNVRIDEPAALEASAEAEGATIYCSCYGASDGSIDLTVTGGTSPYTYLWSPGGETTQDISGLYAGTYSVDVTDENGCTITKEVVVGEPDMLSCEITQDSPSSAHDANDGVATVTPSGGTSPYTYLWDNDETTAQAISLNVGVHSVTVTDDLGCYTTCEIIIECLPNALRCTVAKNSDVTCYDGEDGSAKVTAEGGVPPYKFSWSNGENTHTATSLSEGLHTVKVTDASQAETTCSVRINEPLELEASAEAEGATTYCSCYGANDGSIDLTVTGGTPNYTYLWSNGATSQDLSDLYAGTYSVEVTDANGCITEEEVVVGEPAMLSCEITEDSPVSTNGGSDGVATVIPSGGTPEYTYLWSPGGATTAQATGLSAGSYTVTVTDSSGCETPCDIIITEPDPEQPRASCSYTQGFYGNPGGLACIPENQQVNAKYIMLGALNASGGRFDFGDKNTGKYFSLFLGDIQNDNIFKMLPGGGPSNKLQGYATYDLSGTWDNVPLVDKAPRWGKIKNNLLSQTMTLYFNLYADGLLGNHQLKENFYTAATVECGSEEYLANSVQMFKIPGNVISYLDANNSNTIQGLFNLANDALGGNNIGSLSYSNITEAVDVINNAFDECRVLVSETVYDKVVAGLTDDKPIFTIYPVPFVDTVKIKYEIDSDSEATIQVFDIRGRLVKTVTDDEVYYHKVTELILDYRTFANQMYFIKVSTGDKSTMKKIISVR